MNSSISLIQDPTPSSSTNSTSIPIYDPLDATTFIPPNNDEELPRLVITFCDRCRWYSRAAWVQTELFLTFPSLTTISTIPPFQKLETGIKAIQLIPRSTEESAGIFRIWIYRKEGNGMAELVWDRKLEAKFPEMKELKQRIRNLIQPALSLGHSDKDEFGNMPIKKEEVVEETKVAEVFDASADRPVTLADYAETFRC